MTSFNAFSGYYEFDSFKGLSIVIQTLAIVLGPAFLFAILWHEYQCSDAKYQTFLNHVTGHLCWLMIVGCTVQQTGYLAFFTFGPFPMIACDVIVFTGRLMYLVCVTETLIRQLMKYLFIFKWKLVSCLLDEFFAFFFTAANVQLSVVFAFATYFVGYHNEDIDFHVCTGNSPPVNINLTFRMMNWTNKTFEASEWFQVDEFSDPIDKFSLLAVLIFAPITTRIWIFSAKESLQDLKIWVVRVFCLNSVTSQSSPETSG